MALTAQEEQFYNNFLELLKREGIDAEHSYRLSEVLIFNDYYDGRGNLAENISTPAFIETGENSPFLNDPGDTSKFEGVAKIQTESNLLGNRTNLDGAQKQVVQQEVDRVVKWFDDNMKNPFDPAHKPSEQHIKKLYKAYTEGRLCLDNLAHIGVNPMDNNVAWIAEGEDGTMKLTLPTTEVDNRLRDEKKFRLPYDLAGKTEDLEFAIRTNRSMRTYVIEKFGSQMISDIKLASEPAPEIPSVLTDILAFFRVPSAREKVNAYRRYETAQRNVEQVKKEIAKDVYPGIKHPEKLVRNMAQPTVGHSATVAPIQVHIYTSMIHKAKVDEEVAQKLDVIGKDLSNEEKDILKFALESRYNAKLTVAEKNFLKDIPDIYYDVVKNHGIDVIKIRSIEEEIGQHEDDLELQKKLLKLNEFKSLYREYFTGNINVYDYKGNKELEAAAQKRDPKPEKKAVDAGKGKAKSANGDNQIYINPAKKEFNKKELDHMRRFCEKKFKEHPSVDAFAKWRAFDIAFAKLVKKPSLKNIQRSVIDEKIAKTIAKVNEMPEFKTKLERGNFANCAVAGMEYRYERDEFNDAAQERAEEARKAAKAAEPAVNK